MHIEAFTHEYLTRLGQKGHLLKRFAQITAGIKEIIEAEEIERIASQIEERQGIINKIESIDRALAQLESDSSSSVDRLSGKAKDLVGVSLNQVRTSLEGLTDMDRECLALVQAAYDSIKSDILEFRSGLRVAKCYGGTRNKTPRFLDLKR